MRPLLLGNGNQPAAHAATGVAWVDVELVDPLVFENEESDHRVAIVGYPDISLALIASIQCGRESAEVQLGWKRP